MNYNGRLRTTLEEWIATLGSEICTLSVEKAGRGVGPIFVIAPIEEKAASMKFWVADDSNEFCVAVGNQAWWRDILFSKLFILQLCTAVSEGKVHDDIKTIGSLIVAQRSRLMFEEEEYSWSVASPFSLLPWPAWKTLAYSPWRK
jgi:hypothetical protein